ncbi:hypothetical protein HNS38_11440 [Lentimicrobium sp. L6]|uniref:hypothetical protein n=1 Tax=Lentimicrobium sp. L6 TaxID=2735916 RepID=UPI00155236AD|nr:hypothetical protein [Lentimicrobium sp. L6]NPD85379.1 hypothetical protein [Lentimicrobium sp. L6]
MGLRVLEEDEIRVAGNVNLEDATSSVSLDGNMSISGDLSNSANASNFIIESDANNTGSLIVDGAIIGDYTVERYVTSNTWHFLSATVDNLTTRAFYFDENPLTYIASYNEPVGTWDFISGLDESLPMGIGYKFWVAESKAPITAYMEGELKSTSLSVDLDYGGVGGNWNLIGNPFPSAVDWDDENWLTTNTTGAVYIWDSTFNNGDYRVYNGSTGDLTNGVIPMSQSFFCFGNFFWVF